MSNELLHCEDPIEYITSHIDTPMSIEASAGCGKTYALIARVCALLNQSQDSSLAATNIERCLLLTFTDNAAAEMKSRLISRLQESSDQEWAQQALSQIHRASIQTIHSFAFDICSQFHDSLGLPDDISIIDDVDRDGTIDEYFGITYNAWGNDKNLYDYFRICTAVGLSRSKMRSAFSQVLSLNTFLPGDDIAPPMESFIPPSPHKVIAGARDVIQSAQALSSEKIGVRQAERVDAFPRLARAVLMDETPQGVFTTLERIESFIKTKKFVVQQAKNISETCASFENSVVAWGECITGFRKDLIDSLFRYTMSQLTVLACQYRQEMFSSGQITFDDSIVAARRAIEIPAIREQLWGRYDAIIIDEFQDTDVHQLAIVKLLSQDASLGDIARIFVVGDDKQSIYGFRGATVEGYQDFVRTTGVHRIALDTSRRSVPSIAEAVNSFSAPLFEEYLPLVSAREDFSPSHVRILGDEMDAKKEEVRTAQARDTIDELISMNGRALVRDHDTGELRACNLGDMTILIRDKNSLGSLIETCENRSVTFTIDSSALVWELSPVKMFLAIAQAITYPRDEYSILAALRSPVFQLSNDDLMTYFLWHQVNIDQRSSPWNYRYLPRSEIHSDTIAKVWTALESLRDLHKRSSVITASAFVTMIMDSVVNTANVVVFGPTLAQDVNHFLLSEAISYQDRNPSGSSSDFVRVMMKKRSSNNKSDSYIGSSSDNALRIMTIHASKGLEFPIVAFIPSQGENRDTRVNVQAVDTTLALSLSSKKYDSLLTENKESSQDRFIKEESRLIYVALTRAQDHLLIASHHKPTKSAKTQLDLIAQTATTMPPTRLRPPEPIVATGSALTTSFSDYAHEFSPRFKNQSQAVNRLIRANASSINLSPTSFDDDSPKIHTSRSFLSLNNAPALGKAVHRAMNIINFGASNDDIASIAQRSCINEGLHNDKDYAQCARMITQALGLDILQTADEIIREVPISGLINNIACEGYIDCLIRSGEHYTILDYKTDIIDARNPIEKKIDKHALQLAFYSLLLKNNLDTDAVSIALAFLSGDKVVYTTIDLLEKYEDLARKKISLALEI